MNDGLQILIALLGSSALAAIISGLFQLINNRKSKKTAESIAIQEILAAKIEDIATKYLDRGSVGKNELDTLIRLNEAYHNLGGNGFYKTLMDKVQCLPIDIHR